MSDHIISIRGLSKAFNGHRVLDDVDLDIDQGQVVCVLGPSGAGKSTLLRCICHFEKIDTGHVSVDGTIMGYHFHNGKLHESSSKQIARTRRNIGVVFQQFNLFPHLTALENVIEGPVHVLGLSKSEAILEAEKLLKQVGLTDQKNKYPAQMSGGQQQRVAIARALNMNPKVILFDEPTSALDPELVGEVLQTMKDLANQGITMMVVTHEVGFARDVADIIVIMESGRIIESGPAHEVLGHPKHKRTAEFLRSVR
ncbi:amino acid ABC transporter ATP-binding protein [Desulfobacula sp.]|uniref:amino acid ABC transporter ATP-binding protein n=1 Tax=Desulfobacula sp. TaxID=2593537 RepID=UPI002607F916|nr:amino acid ABC transporter ATP-binding protein [Desulfobacula sp.]